MRRKILALLLSAAMLLSLAACGGANSPGNETKQTDPPAQTQKATDAPKKEKNEDEFLYFPLKPTIEETVLVDEQDIKITATGLTYTSNNAELALTIENNSGKDLNFLSNTTASCGNSVNGWMSPTGYLSVDVPAGKKTNEVMRYVGSSLALYGISDIAVLEIGFEIKDKDYETYLTTGPRQIRTSLADTENSEAQSWQEIIQGKALQKKLAFSVPYSSTEELYNQSGVRIVSSALMVNQDDEGMLLLEVENQSEDAAVMSVQDIAVNDILISAGTWTHIGVGPGKRAILDIDLSYLIDDMIETVFSVVVGKVSFSVELHDKDNNDLADGVPVDVVFPDAAPVFDTEGTELYHNNDVRIVFKDMVEGEYSYDRVHLILLVENNKEEEIRLVFDDISLNDYVASTYNYLYLPAGRTAVLNMHLGESDLEKCGIESVDDIVKIDIPMELSKGYKTIDECTLTYSLQDPAPTPTDPAPTDPAPAASSGIRPEFQEAMDSYEAFFDEYIAFMIKYEEAEDTTPLMADYLKFMSQYVDTMAKMEALGEEEMSDQEALYYAEVTLRISQKLLEVS